MEARNGGAGVRRYADLAREIFTLAPKLGPSRLVAVDGPSGAGKTHFAEQLAAAAGGMPVVHTDELLDGWSDQFTFWPRLWVSVLEPISEGRPGRYRRYDWNAYRFGDDWHEVPVAPIVILDGVSTARAELRQWLTYSVFVDAPLGLRRDRVIARDGESVRPYLERWRVGEDRHFAADATARRADLVVDGAPSVPHDPATEYVLTARGDSVAS